MMSETAFFVKDVISPNGCVSIVMNEAVTKSDDVDAHTKPRISASTARSGTQMAGSCTRIPIFPWRMSRAIRSFASVNRLSCRKLSVKTSTMTVIMNDALQSLRICLAADESVRSGQPVAVSR